MMFWELSFKWWRETESNRRHGDFQSPALPTELSSLLKEIEVYLNIIKSTLKCLRIVKNLLLFVHKS